VLPITYRQSGLYAAGAEPSAARSRLSPLDERQIPLAQL
jgi:hypothetical protein